MSEQESVEEFYSYYNGHSLPIEHIPRVEALLNGYIKNDPNGLRRLVGFLKKPK